MNDGHGGRSGRESIKEEDGAVVWLFTDSVVPPTLSLPVNTLASARPPVSFTTSCARA